MPACSLATANVQRRRPGLSDRRPLPEAAIGISAFGDPKSAAERARSQGYRVIGSDVDLLGDLDSVVDLGAEVSNGAFDLRMSE